MLRLAAVVFSIAGNAVVVTVDQTPGLAVGVDVELRQLRFLIRVMYSSLAVNSATYVLHRYLGHVVTMEES